jgi:hypothetical protein
MNRIFDTLIQSCDELGTLQQDGTIFLSANEIKNCKNLRADPSLTGLEQQYRETTFTTAREEYVEIMLKKLNRFKKRIVDLNSKFQRDIDMFKKEERSSIEIGLEKLKYNDEVARLTKDMETDMLQIKQGITDKYYDVEEIQYKDLVNLMARLSKLTEGEKNFQQNLDTAEAQLLILMDKRRKTHRTYTSLLVLFFLIVSLFIGGMIYYLFSKNNL